MRIDIEESLKNTIKNAIIHTGQVALDVGCGDGHLTKYLAAHSKLAIGLDPEVSTIHAAQNSNHDENPILIVCRGEELCFNLASFDFVLFCQSLHHIPINNQVAALEQARAALFHGGRLTIIEPVYGKGKFGEITALYSGEKDPKLHAIQSARNLRNQGFKLLFENDIQINCTCESPNDLFDHITKRNPNKYLDKSTKNLIEDILSKSEMTATGEIVINYFADVISYTKT
jgi:ubiquinone/menaquinone biosynthesis C-methylase UbiE